MARYADVILPLPLYGTFTYALPPELQQTARPGMRAFVLFGTKNHYTAIIADVHDRCPEDFEPKPIISLFEDEPITRYPQMKLWQWISDYYLCSPGDVYKAALPTGLKVESETTVSVHPDFEEDPDSPLTEKMRAVYDIVEGEKSISVGKIEHQLGQKRITPLINKMIDMGVIAVSERIVDHYRPKKIKMVRAAFSRDDNAALHDCFNRVSRSQRQERMLVSYLDMSGWMNTSKPLREVERQELLDKTEASPAILKALTDKGILEQYTKEINRFAASDLAPKGLNTLSDLQKTAFRDIINSWKEHNVTLLHGVTGSGKTEIYAHLMQSVLNQGSQVLYLVPEISLTTQLTDRLRAMFGDKLIVYHSRFSDSERVDIWKRMLSSHEPRIILGVRSSVFLPFARLGLVIVDEEHEASYKQYNPAPRYNARDVAIVLASMHGAKTLLGSATPSVETYYKATTGRFGLVTLTERHSGVSLPDVEIVDMKAQRKKKLNTGILSQPLNAALRSTLEQHKQAILFQNRRGFAPIVICADCGWTPKCPNCDVSLVYHKHNSQLRCHYCGHTMELPRICPACGGVHIDTFGYGTERIAEEVTELYPDYKVARMDLDTTRNKDAYHDIISRFSEHETDILIGTQMVTKGLDFDSVNTVGVLNADTLLNFPDFRSNERAFNMLEQVAGRAGRRDETGRVLIQTTDPANPVLAHIAAHDYAAYYRSEIADRERYAYPPYTKVINIYLKHKDKRTLDRLAVKYVEGLRTVFAERVLGPEPPFVGRVATYYLQCVMLKIEAGASMKKVKQILRQIYEGMLADPEFRKVQLYFDVDPV